MAQMGGSKAQAQNFLLLEQTMPNFVGLIENPTRELFSIE